MFDSLLGTDIGNGLALTAQYNATDVTLIVSNLSISIDDVSVTEGDAGTVDATFTVTLAEPSGDDRDGRLRDRRRHGRRTRTTTPGPAAP